MGVGSIDQLRPEPRLPAKAGAADVTRPVTRTAMMNRAATGADRRARIGKLGMSIDLQGNRIGRVRLSPEQE
jgi:hypothetical protein